MNLAENPFFILVMVVALGTLAIAVTAAVVLALHIRRRQRELAEGLAARWGWTYTPRAPWLDHRWLGHTFGGFRVQIADLASGQFEGRPAAVCDLTAYRTRLVITALGTPTVIPPLELTPAGFIASVSRVLRGGYVPSGIPEIDARWRIRCATPGLLQSVLTPAMVELLRTCPPVPIRFVSGDVISWYEGMINESKVTPRLALLNHVVSLVPETVWQHFGQGRPADVGDAT